MNPQKIDITISNIKLAEWSHRLSSVRAHLKDIFKFQREAGVEQDPEISGLCDDSVEALEEISKQMGKHCKYE